MTPDDVDRQRDLSVSHNKVGDMQKANGNHGAALKAYRDGIAIAQHLSALDPNIVEWQTDLVVSYYKLAELQPEQAHTLLSKALQILKRLDSENRLDHQKKSWIPILEQAVQ